MSEEKNESEIVNEEKENQVAEAPEQTVVKEEKKKSKSSEKKTASTQQPEKKKAAPKIFFKQDSKVEISINGYHNNDTGELAFAIPADDKNADDDSFGDLFTKVNYKFWFSRCPYDKYNRYRTRSMIYNSEDQNNTINELRLREFFLVFHLVDWNLTDEDGNKVELKFDPNKALSDESLKRIYTLPNTLLDVVLTTYEKKMSL
jgi:hypothetical protein